MLQERINAKPLVTILFFKILDKTGDFAVSMIYMRSTSTHKPVYSDAKIRPALF